MPFMTENRHLFVVGINPTAYDHPIKSKNRKQNSLAKQGDDVAVDDVIVILESMKMEIPIQASKAGNVLEIMVAEEDMVAEGQHIATIESA